MAKHLDTGKIGEQKAIDYFRQNGYVILHQNWREKHWEIDIIAVKNGLLHFIEVKTNTPDRHGFPEENVSVSKIRYLINAAESFLFKYPQWENIQFDVLAITLKPQISFYLIEDVFL